MTLADLIAGLKNALNLGGTNLFPGDVNKALTGTPASDVYRYSTGGYDPIFSEIMADPVGSSITGGISTPSPTGGVIGEATSIPDDGGGDGGGGDSVLEATLAYLANALGLRQEQAENIRTTGQNRLDDILKSVGAFRERAGTLKTSAGQEITNEASDILGSSARSGREARGQSRAYGRAMGLGDSSKFNRQNMATSALAGTQGRTIAKRGEQNRANMALFQEREDAAQAKEDTAQTTFGDLTRYVENLKSMNINQYVGDAQAGVDVFADKVNMANQRQQALQAMGVMNTGGLTGYNADFGGIANTINSLFAPTQTTPTASGQAPSMQNVSMNPNFLSDYYKKLMGLG